MNPQKIVLVITCVINLLITPAMACIWDNETLWMERQRFPEVLELITGKFVHHSTAYYEWRIQDRKKALQRHPNNLNLQDDLAVALFKTGQHQEAIDLATQQLRQQPNRYETLSNLGTFYYLNGEVKKGLPFIEKALKINPEAHFGRERYQKYLGDYLLSKEYAKRFLKESGYYSDQHSFADYLVQQGVIAQQGGVAPEKDTQKAIKGVLGMMRFGDHQSPILLDALASLLLLDFNTDAKHLGARAYLMASYYSKEPERKAFYRERAEITSSRLPDSSLQDVELSLKLELEDTKWWFSEVQNDEKRWIAEKKMLIRHFSISIIPSLHKWCQFPMCKLRL